MFILESRREPDWMLWWASWTPQATGGLSLYVMQLGRKPVQGNYVHKTYLIYVCIYDNEYRRI